MIKAVTVALWRVQMGIKNADAKPSTGCLRVNGSLPNQSTCILLIWKRHLAM